jgi:prevent-host-death family protein
MKEIALSEFKAKCLAILEEVRRTRHPIRVTRFGRPIAEIVPPSEVTDRAAWIGSMKNSIEILGDIVSPTIDGTQIAKPPRRSRRSRTNS